MVIGANSAVSGNTEVAQADVQSSRRSAAHAASVQDSARFTATQEQARKLQDSVNRLPEVRYERVTQLRQAVADGSHNVSSDQIAGAISAEYSQ